MKRKAITYCEDQKEWIQENPNELPELKDWWDALLNVYPKVLHPTHGIARNINRLGQLKERGLQDR